MRRILLLTPQLPYPPHQGTSLRNFHMLKALAQVADVTLLSMTESVNSTDLSPLEPYCRVLPPVPVPDRSQGTRIRQLISSSLPDMGLRLRSDAFASALNKALRSDDYAAVQIEGIELASYIPQIRSASPSARIVLDCHNAEAELQRRARAVDRHNPSRWLAAIYSTIQTGRLARFESWALTASDAILAVSEIDRAQLLKLLPTGAIDITIVPNTIDVVEYGQGEPPSEDINHDLVFTGKMDYRPNVDGVLWFAEKVWPALRDARPDITWAIVGQKPHARLDVLRGKEGITITGFVPYIQPYLAGALIYIVPLRIGSGTRLKILEAMTTGLPIVSTRIGAEGFDVSDQQEMVLADSPEEWVENILRLLNDQERRTEMGAAAHEFAKRYDWRTIIPLMKEVYSNLLDGNHG